MDLGIAGRRAIVCASSRGLGRACALALAGDGVAVTINGRDASALAVTAAEIRRATGSDVSDVVADISTADGRAALLNACPEPDILVTNIGGPPLGDFRDWDEAVWMAALNDMMLTPIFLIRAVIDPMIARRFGRIVNITSISAKMPALDRGLTNGARAGLTGFIAGLARQTVRHNVTINNLLPGMFATDRGIGSVRDRAESAGEAFETYLEQVTARIPAGRFGEPVEFGNACAFLCGSQAGYITGQNIALDGGLYPGTF